MPENDSSVNGEVSIGDRRGSRILMKPNPVAFLADFHHAHQVVRQNALRQFRNAAKYFADIEHVGQGIEKAIESLKPRRKIPLLLRPARSMPSRIHDVSL